MKLTLTALAVATALVLVACGGNGGGSATAAPDSSKTVSLDGDVLVDSQGAALYSSDQEKGGTVRCTGGCTSIWLPLAAPSSGQPTAASGVSGKLGVLKRPDGARQVTLDGRPLYRFAKDGAPGKVTGDGVSDSFGGQRFTWHVEGTGNSTGDSGGGESGGNNGGNSGGAKSYGY
jgi:predicted lipoprotein with Yx(FWY)xxD motif